MHWFSEIAVLFSPGVDYAELAPANDVLGRRTATSALAEHGARFRSRLARLRGPRELEAVVPRADVERYVVNGLGPAGYSGHPGKP